MKTLQKVRPITSVPDVVSCVNVIVTHATAAKTLINEDRRNGVAFSRIADQYGNSFIL